MPDLRKLGEGAEAEIFEWGDGEVVRLLRPGRASSTIALEAAAMNAAAASGVPVPRVIETVTIDDRPGIVMERVDGPDLITLIGRKPWTVTRAGRMLGSIQAQLHGVTAPTILPALRERVRDRIRAAEPLSARLTEHALLLLDRLPDGDALCHGDFHPGNVLLGGNGPVIIDWVNATRGDPLADVARTRLLLRLDALPPGSPAVIRSLHRVGRDLFRWRWLYSYRRHRAIDLAAVDRWEIVRAADRVAEGFGEEVPELLAMLERSATSHRR